MADKLVLEEEDSQLREGVTDRLSKNFSRVLSSYNRYQQIFLDRVNPWRKTRWTVTILLTLLYVARVFYLRGWYIVSYGLGIYMLNLFIAFLSPPIDPDTDGPLLPQKGVDEFRPFVRKLPEFKFWFASPPKNYSFAYNHFYFNKKKVCDFEGISNCHIVHFR